MAINGARKREQLRARDGDRCWLCGGRMNFDKPARAGGASIDHVVPKSRGGSNRNHNLKLAHRRCNQARGDAAPSKEA